MRSDRATGQRGGTLGSVLLAMLLISVVAAIVIPNFMPPKISRNDVAAIATLRNLARVQAEFRESRAIDIDGDGVGEFGTFGELTASLGLRTSADASNRGERLQIPVLSPALAGVTGPGVVKKSGYAFRLFLPGSDGKAVREESALGGGTPFTGPVDVDLAEKRWCAYAWPVKHGLSGTVAFFVDQDGEVWETENAAGRYSADIAGPRWDAAMPGGTGGGWASPDKKLREYSGRDGGAWRKR